MKITPTKVRIEFQQFNVEAQRPYDERLNEKEIVTESLSDIPHVGDYIGFLKEEDGQKGCFKVKTRNLTFNKKDGEWQIYANVVLEEITSDEFDKTIKL